MQLVGEWSAIGQCLFDLAVTRWPYRTGHRPIGDKPPTNFSKSLNWSAIVQWPCKPISNQLHQLPEGSPWGRRPVQWPIVITHSVLKLTEIVILWVYYTIPFCFSLIWNFRAIIFNVWNHFVWLRITDEGSLPEMRIWSILLIKSDLKWCINLSRSLFLYFNYLASVTAGGPRSPRGHM